MTTGTLLFTLFHLVLFIYTRRKYVRKFKKAQAEKARFEIENIQLKSQIKTLNLTIDTFE